MGASMTEYDKGLLAKKFAEKAINFVRGSKSLHHVEIDAVAAIFECYAKAIDTAPLSPGLLSVVVPVEMPASKELVEFFHGGGIDNLDSETVRRFTATAKLRYAKLIELLRAAKEPTK